MELDPKKPARNMRLRLRNGAAMNWSTAGGTSKRNTAARVSIFHDRDQPLVIRKS